MVTCSFHLYSRSSISFHSVFHSFHGLMNSIKWPASSVWVFIAQLGEHCSANAEATGSNPVEAPKIFFSGYFRNCLNCDSLRWSHTHSICIPAVQYHFIQSFLSKETTRRQRLGSNHRPPDWKSNALTTRLPRLHISMHVP